MDTPIDHRNASLCETASGTPLVNTWTSLAYQPLMAEAEAPKQWNRPNSPAGKPHSANNPAQLQALPDTGMPRYTNGGQSPSASRTPSPRSSASASAACS